MSFKLEMKLDKALIHKITKAGGRKATFAALDYLASVSKDQVPLDQGPLKSSCHVDVNEDGTEGTVSYDTPYAVTQHENTSYRHQRGRKAKYLEDPVYDKEVQRQMIDIAKNAFGGEMEG